MDYRRCFPKGAESFSKGLALKLRMGCQGGTGPALDGSPCPKAFGGAGRAWWPGGSESCTAKLKEDFSSTLYPATHSQQFCIPVSFFSDATCPCLPLTAAIRGPRSAARHRHTETRGGTYMHHDKRFVVFPHGTSFASSFRGSLSSETNLTTL